MDSNFFYHSIYDRFIQRQPRACVRGSVNFLFKKPLLSQKLLTGFLPYTTGMFLDRGQKRLATITEKNQVCGVIQTLKRLLFPFQWIIHHG